MTIGQRAVQAIREMAVEKGVTFKNECELLLTSDINVLYWNRTKTNPRADILAEMCRQGYDMTYILTGERKNEN